MDYKLKNVFWLSGTNQNGFEKFIPIMFNKELNKIYLIKDNYTMMFFCSLSKEEIIDRLAECKETGVVDFISPEGLFLGKKIRLYHSPKLLLKSLENCTFNKLPKDFYQFLELESCYIVPDGFDKFCENESLSRRTILSYKKAFNKAAKILSSSKENSEIQKKLEHLPDYSELRKTLDGFYVSKTDSNEDDSKTL